jgi:Ni/Co efflux regulator RcnB
MKILTLALVATALAATPLVASAKDSAPNSPAERTAALLASGRDIRVNQVAVQVETGNPENHPYNHHRHYRTVKVVKYRDGVRYVTYRRVYDHDNG